LVVNIYSKNFLNVMEPKGSLPCSK
jgi:hypothetical protein